MLYDPKWEKTTKADPTLAGFAAWLETKDPNEEYGWFSGDCAIGQYVKQLGFRSLSALTYDQYNALEGGYGGQIAMGCPRTFGAALKRARAVLASRS